MHTIYDYDKYLHYKLWERWYLMYLGSKKMSVERECKQRQRSLFLFRPCRYWVSCLSSSRYMQKFKYNINKKGSISWYIRCAKCATTTPRANVKKSYSSKWQTKWRNHIAQLENVHGVNGVRQTEIHTEEPPVPEVELAFEKLKSYESLSID